MKIVKKWSFFFLSAFILGISIVLQTESVEAGTIHHGWYMQDTDWHYKNPDGSQATGWIKVNGSWYFMDNAGVMQSGWLSYKGNRYYLDSTGAMKTGWVKNNGVWYYFDKSGAMQTGWIYINKSWYYLDINGQMQTGWVSWKNNWYFCNTDGRMATGWIKYGDYWYYLDKSGMMQTGWVKVKKLWYYMDSSGAMQTGKLELNGKTYLLQEDGSAFIGWTKEDGSWVLYDASCARTSYGQTLIDTTTAKIQNESSNTSYLVVTDTANTSVFIYTGRRGAWTFDRAFICAPGLKSTPTRLGRFTISNKGYSFGKGFTCYYYTQYSGPYLFHSILYYQDTWKVQDPTLGKPASHGCLRLSTENAKWIYDNIPRGTKVWVY